MQCPKCRLHPLVPHNLDIAGVAPVLGCVQCCGYWFEEGQLDDADESMVVNVERELSPVAGEVPYGCPSCPSVESYGYRGGSQPVALQALSHPEMPKLVIWRCPSCRGHWAPSGMLHAARRLASRLTNGMAKNVSITSGDDGTVVTIHTLTQ